MKLFAPYTLTKHERWLFYNYRRSFICTRLAALMLCGAAFGFVGLALLYLSVLVFRQEHSAFGQIFIQTLLPGPGVMLAAYLTCTFLAALLFFLARALWMLRLWAWWIVLLSSAAGVLAWLGAQDLSVLESRCGLFCIAMFALLLTAMPVFTARAADT